MLKKIGFGDSLAIFLNISVIILALRTTILLWFENLGPTLGMFSKDLLWAIIVLTLWLVLVGIAATSIREIINTIIDLNEKNDRNVWRVLKNEKGNTRSERNT